MRSSMSRAAVRSQPRFNEAEARTPRMAGAVDARCASCRQRFNEAEARTPRMATQAHRRLRPHRPCFNEAEARAPRMRCASRWSKSSLRSASMRPRRVRLGCADVGDGNRGDRCSASMRPRRVRLGCGRFLTLTSACRHRFNEAEARTPRMAARLLWPRRWCVDRQSDASMRPRRVRLGCVATLELQAPASWLQ